MTTAAAAAKCKGKILFLHGYTQLASIFYAKSLALRKKLMKMGYKVIYLQGPLKLTGVDLPNALGDFNTIVKEEDDNNLRAWWVKKLHTNNNIDLTEAFTTVEDYVKHQKLIDDPDMKVQEETEEEKKLPIVGLVGFSQGAAMAGLLAATWEKLYNVTPLKFCVLYSGFKLDTAKTSGNHQYDGYYPEKLPEDLKLLHVYGELDTVVEEARSLSLYNYYKSQLTLLKHPGGHFVPNSKLYVDQVTNWLQLVENGPVEKKEDQSLDDIMSMMDNLGKA